MPARPLSTADKAIRLLALLWMVCTILLGALLTSYHQPFQQPDARDTKLLALVPPATEHQWRAIHILSGGCACSQRVMAHLLARHRLPNIDEQILLVDGPEPYLSGSSTLIANLKSIGYEITHLATTNIPQDVNLRGVPLLILATPEEHIAYLGGYGPRSDQDTVVLAALRQGTPIKPLPILGCAIGAHLRRTLDPLHLKY